MKLKKKIRKFFTLTRKANEGFTLVELIITIAIVAILGGVAVPAYTGYIAKADAAADAQLLGDINKAFAAACLVEGIDNYGAQSAAASLTEEKTVGEVTIDGENITATFDKFYEGGAFKKTEELEYDPAIGGFYDPAKGTGNGSNAPTIEQLKQLLNGSSYSNLTLTDLTGDVSELVGELSAFFAASENNREMLLGSGFSTYLEGMGKTVGEMSNTELANAAALYLADRAANMTDDKIAAATTSLQFALLDAYVDGSQPLTKELVDSWSESTGSNLASYAMLYATAEAVALQNGGKDGDLYKELKTTDMKDQTAVLTAAMKVFESTNPDDLDAYITDQAPADMEAYFKALQTVNTKEDELVGQLNNEKLFTDSDTIKDLLTQLGS